MLCGKAIDSATTVRAEGGGNIVTHPLAIHKTPPPPGKAGRSRARIFRPTASRIACITLRTA